MKVAYDKKALHKGFKGIDGTDGDDEFLKLDADPFDKVTPADTYHAKRFDDHDYDERGCGAYTDCDHGLVNKEADEAQASIRSIYDLIDNQSDQPAGKLLGGGGPVSDNESDPRDSSWRGRGSKGPRYKNPLGAQGQGNMRKPR